MYTKKLFDYESVGEEGTRFNYFKYVNANEYHKHIEWVDGMMYERRRRMKGSGMAHHRTCAKSKNTTT